MNTDQIMDYIKQEIASTINRSPDTLDENLNFLKLGISSIQVLKIINRIQTKLDVEFSPIAMFEYKTLSQFVTYLAQCMNEKEAQS